MNTTHLLKRVIAGALLSGVAVIGLGWAGYAAGPAGSCAANSRSSPRRRSGPSSTPSAEGALVPLLAHAVPGPNPLRADT